MAIPGGFRYFGFVIGAPQGTNHCNVDLGSGRSNAGLVAAGPSAAVVEEVSIEIQLRGELLTGLPTSVSQACGSTGCQIAHT